jgi:hypothetical protein
MNQMSRNDVTAGKSVDLPARGSVFADRQAAAEAIEILRPMLALALGNSAVGESGCLHVVIMDPALTPAETTFEEAILYEFSLPEPQQWDADYGAFARAKARLSWNLGVDSHLIQSCQPHRLRSGDTALWGSVAYEGIVVGVSGADPWFDEAFAACVAHCLKAIAQRRAGQMQRQLYV